MEFEPAVAALGAVDGELTDDVEAGRLDDPEAAEVLLGFQERPVGEQGPAAPGVDHGRGRGRCEAAGDDPVAAGHEPVVEHTIAAISAGVAELVVSSSTDTKNCMSDHLLRAGARRFGIARQTGMIGVSRRTTR